MLEPTATSHLQHWYNWKTHAVLVMTFIDLHNHMIKLSSVKIEFKLTIHAVQVMMFIDLHNHMIRILSAKIALRLLIHAVQEMMFTDLHNLTTKI